MSRHPQQLLAPFSKRLNKRSFCLKHEGGEGRERAAPCTFTKLAPLFFFLLLRCPVLKGVLCNWIIILEFRAVRLKFTAVVVGLVLCCTITALQASLQCPWSWDWF